MMLKRVRIWRDQVRSGAKLFQRSLLAATCIFICGCNQPAETPQPHSTAERPSSVTLHVAVVNNADVAAGIGRLRGEWAELSGGEIEIGDISRDELFDKDLKADVLVYPSRYLGELSDLGRLRPIRSGILTGQVFDAADVFRLVVDRLIKYGGETMALPLGVQAGLICYRSEALKQARIAVPATWPEYAELVDVLAAEGTPAAEPMRQWGVPLFLERVAPLAYDTSREAILFDPLDMRPRISEPPFVRALETMQQVVAKLQIFPSTDTELHSSMPERAVAAVLFGKASMGIGVPPHAGQESRRNAVDDSKWAELPGSGEYYDTSLGTWEFGDIRRIPVMGAGSYLVSVADKSRNAASAFRFIEWLSSSEINVQLSSATRSMPFRRSQLRILNRWYGGDLGQSQPDSLGRATEDTFSRARCLMIPRLLDVDDYLAALRLAVEEALFEEIAAELSLTRAAQAWEEITERIGRDRQRDVYVRQLNLAE